MAGRIRDEDIALVREKSPIDDVIGEHVQLRNAGGGNLKGMCPFHDEKSPSFNVTPARGLFYCFGCRAGGDVIKFVQDIEHLDFSDAVERLAARAGIQLRYVEGGGPAPDRHRGQRQRLLEAHREAAAFYAEQLSSAEAEPAREFLRSRGFDVVVAARYGCGFAPVRVGRADPAPAGQGVHRRRSSRWPGCRARAAAAGYIDRFHRRLLWPIRDVGGDVVGFGARRLFDDDRIEAKYLNTPETPIYKKSQLLYGVDLAKKDIARQHRAVIVEGYTDVMACHLSGVTTAVATCGTAFGTEHVSVIRRLLMDSDAFTGEVIFTFDGDAAGHEGGRAGLRRRPEVHGADVRRDRADRHGPVRPAAEVRRHRGAATSWRGASRSSSSCCAPRSARFDLDTAEGAGRRARPRHPARRADQGPRAARRVRAPAGRAGRVLGEDDPMRVVHRVRGLVRSDDSTAAPAAGRSRPQPEPTKVDEAVAAVEREVLKVALQLPAVAGPEFDALAPEAFLIDAHRQVRAGDRGGRRHRRRPSPARRGSRPSQRTARPTSGCKRGVHALAVEPLRSGADRRRALRRRGAGPDASRSSPAARSRAIKSRLQRINPLEQPDEHARLFGELIALESYHRGLRERANGGQ